MLTQKTVEATIMEPVSDLREHVFTVFDNVYTTLKTLHDDNSITEAHLNKIEDHQKWHDEMFTQTFNRLDRHDEMFTETFRRLDRHDEMFRQTFQLILAQSTNQRAARPMHRIEPIGIFSTSSPPELLYPSVRHFPTTVKQFWNLNAENLYHLCEFYQVTREELVGDDHLELESDSEQESSSSTSSSTSRSLDARRSLRRAVEDNRALAQSCLAERLQLDYQKIEYNMETIAAARKQSEQHEKRGMKRSVASGAEAGKRRRPFTGPHAPAETAKNDNEPDEALPTASWNSERIKKYLPTSMSDRIRQGYYDPSEQSEPDIVRWAKGPLPEPRRIVDEPNAQPNLRSPESSNSDAKSNLDIPIRPGHNTVEDPRKTSQASRATDATTKELTNTPSPYRNLKKNRPVEPKPSASRRARPGRRDSTSSGAHIPRSPFAA